MDYSNGGDQNKVVSEDEKSSEQKDKSTNDQSTNTTPNSK